MSVKLGGMMLTKENVFGGKPLPAPVYTTNPA